MTILRAIELADMARANEIEPELKLFWLSTLDGQIKKDVFDDNWQYTPPVPFQGYGPDTDINHTELLVQAPYDEIYPLFLIMRIDLENNEIDRFNNDAKLFDEAFKRFAWQHNRTHRSKSVPFVRF